MNIIRLDPLENQIQIIYPKKAKSGTRSMKRAWIVRTKNTTLTVRGWGSDWEVWSDQRLISNHDTLKAALEEATRRLADQN